VSEDEALADKAAVAVEKTIHHESNGDEIEEAGEVGHIEAVPKDIA
jgi:hypothetical protein